MKSKKSAQNKRKPLHVGLCNTIIIILVVMIVSPSLYFLNRKSSQGQQVDTLSSNRNQIISERKVVEHSDKNEEFQYDNNNQENAYNISTTGRGGLSSTNLVWIKVPGKELPLEYIKAQGRLKEHTLQLLSPSALSTMKLEDVIDRLHSHPACASLPVIVSMATVFSDLYWQLIENFIYTMVKFDLIQCALMVTLYIYLSASFSVYMCISIAVDMYIFLSVLLYMLYYTSVFLCLTTFLLILVLCPLSSVCLSDRLHIRPRIHGAFVWCAGVCVRRHVYAAVSSGPVPLLRLPVRRLFLGKCSDCTHRCA
jgi:hypothetical protein